MIRDIFRNFATLLFGQIGSSILTFATVAYLARSIGIESFGAFVILSSASLLCQKFVGVQSWQAIIKYHSKNESLHYSRMSFCFYLDVFLSILAVVIFVLLMAVFASVFGLIEQEVVVYYSFSVFLLFSIQNAPTAFFRLEGKYNVIVISNFLGVLFRFIFCIIFIDLNTDMYIIGFIWGAAYVINSVLLLLLFCLYCRKKIFRIKFILLNISLIEKRFIKHVFASYIEGSIKSIRDFDVLIVGALLSLADTSLYKIAREFTKVLTRLTNPFHQVIIPYVSKMVSKGEIEELFTLIRRLSFIIFTAVSLGWILIYFSSTYVITVFYGEEYLSAKAILVLCTLSVVFWAISLPYAPVLYSLGFLKLNTFLNLFLATMYISLLILLLHFYGLVGAGVALVLFFIAWCMLFVFTVEMKKESVKNTLNKA